ncbi:unnamed protein product, partial [Porites evermanni]
NYSISGIALEWFRSYLTNRSQFAAAKTRFTQSKFRMLHVLHCVVLVTFAYTWRQTQPTVHCRLDFFLTSQSFLGSITSANILPGFKTDHSMITLNISLHSNPRGPGFWKLNTSLLADKDYIDLIRLTIQETENEYANDKSINPALLWDMIKLKIREKSLSF